MDLPSPRIPCVPLPALPSSLHDGHPNFCGGGDEIDPSWIGSDVKGGRAPLGFGAEMLNLG